MDRIHRFVFEHRRLLAAVFTGLAVLTALSALSREPEGTAVLARLPYGGTGHAASDGSYGFVHTSVSGRRQGRTSGPRSVPAQRGLRRPHRLQRHRGTAHHLAADAGQPAGAIGGRGWAQFDDLGLLSSATAR